ncbi:hypothetical protein [Micromonospora sp. NPDC047730]
MRKYSREVPGALADISGDRQQGAQVGREAGELLAPLLHDGPELPAR